MAFAECEIENGSNTRSITLSDENARKCGRVMERLMWQSTHGRITCPMPLSDFRAVMDACVDNKPCANVQELVRLDRSLKAIECPTAERTVWRAARALCNTIVCELMDRYGTTALMHAVIDHGGVVTGAAIAHVRRAVSEAIAQADETFDPRQCAVLVAESTYDEKVTFIVPCERDFASGINVPRSVSAALGARKMREVAVREETLHASSKAFEGDGVRVLCVREYAVDDARQEASWDPHVGLSFLERAVMC